MHVGRFGLATAYPIASAHSQNCDNFFSHTHTQAKTIEMPAKIRWRQNFELCFFKSLF
jgi:hypothetical protein